jgi:tetratricopeptide (TPR) repeat protein
VGTLRSIGAAAALFAVAVTAAAAASTDAPAPAPDLPAPAGVLPESAIDELQPDDPRRPELLVDLALARHAEAEALEAEERRAHLEALARWRAGAAGTPAPVSATPRGDARRAEAVRLAERALEETQGLSAFPRTPAALLVAGIDADRIGRPRDALRWLGRLVRRYPESPLAVDGWVALGEHHLREGNLTQARAALEVAARASRRPELRAWAEARLAEAALGATDAEGALAALERGLAARSAAALTTLDRLAASPERLSFGAPALLGLAELLDATGAPARAATVRERALRLAPAGPAAARARSELERTRRLLEAAPLRVAAVAVIDGAAAPLQPAAAPPPTPAPRLGAFAGERAALRELARAALDGGRAGEARLLLDRALLAGPSAAPEEADLRVDLAAALWALGDPDGARAELGRALALAPDHAAALEDAGLVALATRGAEEAEPLLARASAAEPGRWRPRLLHARALAALGRPAEALAEAERVLQLARGQADALQLATGLRETAAAERAP